MPNATDEVIIVRTNNNPRLDQARTAEALTIRPGAILDLAGNNLRVTESFHNAGTLKLLGNEKIEFTINTDAGKVEYYGAGTYFGLNAGYNYFDLSFSGAGTYTLSNTLSVARNLSLTNPSAVLDLNGNDLILTANSEFSNAGTLKLIGSEALIEFRNDTTQGTIEYYGTGTYPGLTAGYSYYNLIIASGALGPYKRDLILTHPSGLTLTDYQIRLQLTASNFDFNLSTDDGRDLCFLDAQGNRLDYWIESWDKSNNQTAVVWIKVPSIPPAGTTISMYYGNSGLNSMSNFTNTFSNIQWTQGSSSQTLGDIDHHRSDGRYRHVEVYVYTSDNDSLIVNVEGYNYLTH